MKNHYETLGLSNYASPEEIKRTYYKLAKGCHPDACPGDEIKAAEFKRISESYKFLSDPMNKACLDSELHALEHANSPVPPKPKQVNRKAAPPPCREEILETQIEEYEKIINDLINAKVITPTKRHECLRIIRENQIMRKN